MLEELRTAHDTNAAIFRDAIAALDAAVQAMAAALDDHVAANGNIRTVAVEGTQHVDYDYYLRKFEKTLDMRKGVEESLLVYPEEDEIHVFGGV